MREHDGGKIGTDAGAPELINIDIDEQRDPAIDLWGLPATDEPRTFYYDETNNDRTIHLTDDGFNVPDPRPFVLEAVMDLGGGLIHSLLDEPLPQAVSV